MRTDFNVFTTREVKVGVWTIAGCLAFVLVVMLGVAQFVRPSLGAFDQMGSVDLPGVVEATPLA